jgi:hypothetical protein
MDHYEELGLSRAASQEEIRQAYRRVARLLHPDRCKDDESRRLADLQMKRLNHILEILTDSAARLSYDEQLLLGPAPPALRTRRANYWVGPLCACILLASLIYTATRRNESARDTRADSSPRASQPVAKSSPPARPEARISHVRRVLRAAVPPPDPPMLLPPPSDIASPVPPELPVTLPPLAVPLPLPPSIAPAKDSLAGEWFYVPPPNVRHGELYPPEYIQLRLTEEEGILAGRYTARYRVSDRAISPNVAFHFESRAGEEAGKIAWTGAGGARGRLTLRRLDNGSLEVSWKADQLGTDLGLVSGTATLVRKRE